jgi:hypothetical protein
MIGNRPVAKLDLPKTFFLVCGLCFRPVAFLSQKNLHSSGLELHVGAPNESLYNNVTVLLVQEGMFMTNNGPILQLYGNLFWTSYVTLT